MLGLRVTLLALAIPIVACATQAAGQSAPPRLRNILAPHRAVYDIGLARADQGSGVSSAEGRMVFEVTGSACQGYTMRQRMVVNIGDEEGKLGRLDFRITTFESGAGDLYTFDSRTTMNQEVIEAVEGTAQRHGSNIQVTLKQPQEKTVLLDGGVLFPSQHLQAIIDAALAKRNILSVDIYEGAGTGESSDAATAAIGKATFTRDGDLLGGGVREWPVSVGYFDAKGVSKQHLGEELPTYQMSFILYENGVTSNLVMDYGDYALTGSLKKFERLASPDCTLSSH